jgi:hypothetical protein
MTSSTEQARRRRQLNQRIRDLIAIRRAVDRPAAAGTDTPSSILDDRVAEPAP